MFVYLKKLQENTSREPSNYVLIPAKSLEERFPHNNWVVILLLQLLNGTALSLVTPSIYQFITTPTTPPEELTCDKDKVHGVYILFVAISDLVCSMPIVYFIYICVYIVFRAMLIYFVVK